MNEQLRIERDGIYIGQVLNEYAWPMKKVGEDLYIAALPTHEGVTWNENTFRPGDIMGRSFAPGIAVDLSEAIENRRLVFLEDREGLWLRVPSREERTHG